MLKFLFGGKQTTPVVEIETDRARFARLVNELNGMVDALADKPRVTVDPATGHVLLETPEQFADEALALPAPDMPETETPEPEAPGEDVVADAPAPGPVSDAKVEPEASGR